MSNGNEQSRIFSTTNTMRLLWFSIFQPLKLPRLAALLSPSSLHRLRILPIRVAELGSYSIACLFLDVNAALT